jgi:hypothetical protein
MIVVLNKGQALLVASPEEDWSLGKRLKNKIVIVRANVDNCDDLNGVQVEYSVGGKRGCTSLYKKEFIVLK